MPQDRLLVITSYPVKGKIHGVGTVGIASYTKNTLLNILKAAKTAGVSLQITVLAEKLSPEQSREYTEDGIKVRRIWQRGSIGSFLEIYREVLKEEADRILLEFEVFMFGNPLNLFFFPMLLLLIKIKSKKIYFVPHQIIADINDLSGHINLQKNSLGVKFLNVLIDLFFRISIQLTFQTIVFEESLKKKFRGNLLKKIKVIPHGVERVTPVLTAGEARKQLGIKDEFVVLYFGFLAWYKGADWLVENIKDQNIKLIIAGGANPNHLDKPYYHKYLKSIEEAAEASNGKITVTGFVEEKNIELYFRAADLVILPYRTFMSSSGPMSIAFSFGKPVILSDALLPYKATPDFAMCMEEVNLSDEEIFFSLSDDSLNKILSGIKSHGLGKLADFSLLMKEKRSFNRIGEDYFRFIFDDEKTF
ncbi:hypothetical protein A3D78_02775 [Candidatus Gottesmanbacteria bacterium RIFCSPHIGHO2_02_FULL_39_14]|uniref:Glycosyl transferase family 1 domain-containing protein n=1 Tax=Candidatus Gottesmanbacteria bacterium RIFCSPHIGHO2_02_FULL_39_14 TaxID=1798383 RepID=A0A1F5ZYI4_9BACT|nr:MAG: hypothetical protein A3D78_02775 [Candidatus Gottesmanbacteria bacterium RIFCSPHIGHO2_02_FULL_39_14]